MLFGVSSATIDISQLGVRHIKVTRLHLYYFINFFSPTKGTLGAQYVNSATLLGLHTFRFFSLWILKISLGVGGVGVKHEVIKRELTQDGEHIM